MEETKFTDTLAELEKAKCHKCNKLVFTSEEIQNAVESGIKSNLYELQSSRLYFKSRPFCYYECRSCAGWFKSNIVLICRAIMLAGIAFVLIVIALSLYAYMYHGYRGWVACDIYDCGSGHYCLSSGHENTHDSSFIGHWVIFKSKCIRRFIYERAWS